MDLAAPRAVAALADAGATRADIGVAWFCNTRQGVLEGQHGIRGQAALRALGFDYVFDSNFGADLTIMEEGSELLARLREPQGAGACASCGQFDACRGGCMAAKFFTGLPLDGPDPECVHGHGEALLAARSGGAAAARPLPSGPSPPGWRALHRKTSN